jgi:IclR helix-turn-helix domain
VWKHLMRLHEEGVIVRAGYDHRQRGSVVWKVVGPQPLPLRPAMPDERTAIEPLPTSVPQTTPARRGRAPRRVLDVIVAQGGRASQAQIAAATGLSPGTVHDHCLSLQALGAIVPGGVDKSTSRRGSTVWRLPPARTQFAPAATRRLRVRVSPPPGLQTPYTPRAAPPAVSPPHG